MFEVKLDVIGYLEYASSYTSASTNEEKSRPKGYANASLVAAALQSQRERLHTYRSYLSTSCCLDFCSTLAHIKSFEGHVTEITCVEVRSTVPLIGDWM